jgi:hypothetical protein
MSWGWNVHSFSAMASSRSASSLARASDAWRYSICRWYILCNCSQAALVGTRIDKLSIGTRIDKLSI